MRTLLAGKSFGLSHAAVENADVDKIEKAKKSAFRFLSKIGYGL